jgi:hypothetical protein
MAANSAKDGSSAGKDSLLNRVTSIAALVRDVGVIVGIPVVLTVGMKLYDLQTKGLEAQMRGVEAQNEVLKLTQYDRALAMMKAQKEIFENERVSLEMRIAELSSGGKQQVDEINKLNKQLAALDNFKRNVEKAEKEQRTSSEQMALLMMTLMMNQKFTDENSSPPPPPPPPPASNVPGSANVRIRK